ncbi:hypothetical protein SPI_04176 [Niveomyces insectorum RCEF 264]|uniref:Molybdate-anion transporter n=1 Tax=Niveomyces insectorum RCEF 264 TaxID=1081102 RepID=A0A167VHX0_9HYPO|nr:hypothetical protein SPI_04176 [Niveomyces insectorum RCEF 264]
MVAMDVYKANLGGLLGLCAALYAAQQLHVETKDTKPTAKKANGRQGAQGGKVAKKASSSSSSGFLLVYTLVMAADWLQGPYLYALYTDEHRAAAAGGPRARGRQHEPADEEDDGGDAAVAEAEAAAAAVAAPADDSRRTALAHTFSRMGTLNSLAAIASGVASEWAVAASGTRKAPFVASAVLLAVAFWRIGRWDENYGEAAAKDRADGGGRVWAVLRDPAVLALGLAATLFEGAMYLFVFFWPPALRAATTTAAATSDDAVAAAPLPYGTVFACFMAAALAATLAFDLLTARYRLVRCATLLLALLAAAETVFYSLSTSSSSTTSSARSPTVTFWLFCLFEACVGTYWPCMGALKGQLVPDGARAQVYALLRVPLNAFVVAALLLAPDSRSAGAADAYQAVFGVCATLLLLAVAGVLAMVVNEPNLP